MKRAIELVVWALPKGSTDPIDAHVLSSTCRTAEDVERVKAAAGADGWHSFVVQTLDLETPPDFVKAVLS